MMGTAEKEEDLGSLNQAIAKLTEIEKAVVMLYLDEKTYDEISEIIGISNSNVGVRLNRIKNKLSELIKINQNEYWSIKNRKKEGFENDLKELDALKAIASELSDQ